MQSKQWITKGEENASKESENCFFDCNSDDDFRDSCGVIFKKEKPLLDKLKATNTSEFAMTIIHELGFQLLDHPVFVRFIYQDKRLARRTEMFVERGIHHLRNQLFC